MDVELPPSKPTATLLSALMTQETNPETNRDLISQEKFSLEMMPLLNPADKAAQLVYRAGFGSFGLAEGPPANPKGLKAISPITPWGNQMNFESQVGQGRCKLPGTQSGHWHQTVPQNRGWKRFQPQF